MPHRRAGEMEAVAPSVSGTTNPIPLFPSNEPEISSALSGASGPQPPSKTARPTGFIHALHHALPPWYQGLIECPACSHGWIGFLVTKSFGHRTQKWRSRHVLPPRTRLLKKSKVRQNPERRMRAQEELMLATGCFGSLAVHARLLNVRLAGVIGSFTSRSLTIGRL